MKPDFLGIGGQRCATTWIFNSFVLPQKEFLNIIQIINKGMQKQNG